MITCDSLRVVEKAVMWVLFSVTAVKFEILMLSVTGRLSELLASVQNLVLRKFSVIPHPSSIVKSHLLLIYFLAAKFLQ